MEKYKYLGMIVIDRNNIKKIKILQDSDFSMSFGLVELEALCSILAQYFFLQVN